MLMHCDTVDAKHLPLGLELFRGLAQHVHVLLRACATACVMSSFTFDVSGSVREHVRPMSDSVRASFKEQQGSREARQQGSKAVGQ
jgi:hypothetical protein